MFKMTKCKQCKTKVETPYVAGIFSFCGIEHAKDYAFANIDKGRKKIISERKKSDAKKKREFKLNDKSYRLKMAQQAFNKFIRIRDESEPCISCQRHHEGQYHAGHYKTAGGFPELRFNELNCHKQCSACNNYLSGNITQYRINLIDKIGLNKVEWLEGPHEPKKYTCEELLAIEKKYKDKIK